MMTWPYTHARTRALMQRNKLFSHSCNFSCCVCARKMYKCIRISVHYGRRPIRLTGFFFLVKLIRMCLMLNTKQYQLWPWALSHSSYHDCVLLPAAQCPKLFPLEPIGPFAVVLIYWPTISPPLSFHFARFRVHDPPDRIGSMHHLVVCGHCVRSSYYYYYYYVLDTFVL